jgi:hypothetical protein
MRALVAILIVSALCRGQAWAFPVHGGLDAVHNGLATSTPPGTGVVSVSLETNVLTDDESMFVALRTFYEPATHVIEVTGQTNPAHYAEVNVNQSGRRFVGYELTLVGADFSGVPDVDPFATGSGLRFELLSSASPAIASAQIDRGTPGQATLRILFDRPLEADFFILYGGDVGQPFFIDNPHGQFTILSALIVPEPGAGFLALVGIAAVLARGAARWRRRG